MKKRILLVIVLTTIAIMRHLQAQQTVSGFEAPESVLKSGDKIFVSNVGLPLNPLALDSNGYISLLSAQGNIVEKKFNKAILHGPKGMAVIGNTLYTADINRIVGLDINSGSKVFEIDFPDAKMLNDLCTADDNRLVVSETINGKIYMIDINGKSYKLLANINGANGVTYDAATKKLYACGMGMNMDGSGKLYEKDMNANDSLFNELPNSPTGIFDGLEMIDNDNLLVTDWHGADSTKGKIVIYNLKNNSTKTYAVNVGPADVGYDKAAHTFYLPQMLLNSVLIENLDELKKD